MVLLLYKGAWNRDRGKPHGSPLPHHRTCGSASGGSTNVRISISPLAFVGGRCRGLLGPLAGSQRLLRLRPTSRSPIRGNPPSMLVPRMFHPRFVCRSALRPVSRFPCSPWMVVTPSTTSASADFYGAIRRPLDLLSLVSETRRRSPRIRYDNFPLILAAFT